MKKILIKHPKVFSEEFRKARVKEYESGRYSVSEISKLYNVSTKTIYQWIYRYSIYNKKSYKIVEMKNSGKQKIKELHEKIRQLEQIVGQKQIQIEYLESMIELAKEEYQIDIKKNSSIKSSTTSEKKKK